MPVSGEEESACEVYHVAAGGNENSLGEGDDVAILTSTRSTNLRNYINVTTLPNFQSKPRATHEFGFGCVFWPRVDKCRTLSTLCEDLRKNMYIKIISNVNYTIFLSKESGNININEEYKINVEN